MRAKWICLIILFSTALFGEDPAYEAYVNALSQSFAKEMKEELNLEWIQWGGIFRDYLKEGMDFYAERRASLEEARALELAVLNRFSEKSQLSPESLHVSIEFRHPKSDGSIEKVQIFWWDRVLHYTSSESLQESYDEAVRLNKENPIEDLRFHQRSPLEEELDRRLEAFAEEMEKNHSIHFKTLGWRVPGKKSTRIRASCQISSHASVEEAREQVLFIADKLLSAVNIPLKSSDITLEVAFRKYKHFVGHVPYYDGSVDTVTLSNDKLIYTHQALREDWGDIHEEVVFAEETYQEALKAPKPTYGQKIATAARSFGESVSNFFKGVLILLFFLFFSLFGL